MSEGGTRDEKRLSQKERTVRSYADGCARRLRRAARGYPEIRELLLKYTSPPEGTKFQTAELLGKRGNYLFTRHSPRYLDLEIKKTPARAGEDVIEQVVILRSSVVDSLVRSSKLSQSNGVERFENEESAYNEVDSFVSELEAQF